MASNFPFINDAQFEQLLANGRMSQACQDNDQEFDPLPVVKLFTPDGRATWLLSEIDPDEPGIAFGLCDLGLGFPELGRVSLEELRTVRGWLQLPIEQDLYFRAKHSLSAYADAARAAGRILA